MTASSPLPAPNLMPLMRYRELADAMTWLEQAFGFEKQIAVNDSNGAVIYGQMTYGNGLLMLGAVRDTDLDKLMRQPDEVGGVETQSCYIVVGDADGHYARACDAGAEIVLDIKSDGLGRRGYSCRDPQGHIWNFGTYDPCRGLSGPAAAASPLEEAPPARTRRPRFLVALAGLMCAAAAVGWTFREEIKADFSQRLAQIASERSTAETARAYEELVKVRSEKRDADQAAAAAAKDLEAERARRASAEANAQKVSAALADAEKARAAAEAEKVSLREDLARGQDALAAAVEARRISEEKLAVKTSQAEEAPAQRQGEPPHSAPPAAATPAPTAEAAPSAPRDIETSATGTPPASAIPAPILDKVPAADGDSSSKGEPKSPAKAPTRAKKAAQPSNRFRPTYLVDLHDVPWPYSTWYHK